MWRRQFSFGIKLKAEPKMSDNTEIKRSTNSRRFRRSASYASNWSTDSFTETFRALIFALSTKKHRSLFIGFLIQAQCIWNYRAFAVNGRFLFRCLKQKLPHSIFETDRSYQTIAKIIKSETINWIASQWSPAEPQIWHVIISIAHGISMRLKPAYLGKMDMGDIRSDGQLGLQCLFLYLDRLQTFPFNLAEK